MFNSTKKHKKNKKSIKPTKTNVSDTIVTTQHNSILVQPLIPNKEDVTLQSIYKFLVAFSDRTEQRFDRIESDIVTIKSDIVRINSTISRMQIDIDKFHNYMKTESTFQEIRDTQYIKQLYSINHSTSIVQILDIENIYNRNGTIVTELDGFLFVTDVPLTVPSFTPNDRGSRSTYAMPLSEQKPIVPCSATFCPSSMSYIIIESKHGLTKTKLDTKLKQFITLKELFTKMSDDNRTQYHKLYIDMIDQLVSETQLPLSAISQPTPYMIISSDDISDQLFHYITAIHDGISDEETYDTLMHSMLFSDKYVTHGLFKQMTTGQRIPISFKEIIKKRGSMTALRDMFSRKNEWMNKLDDFDSSTSVDSINQIIHDYLLPFSNVKATLDQLKHHIGVLRLDTVYLPTLFTIETTKKGAGWNPGAPRAYDPTESNYLS